MSPTRTYGGGCLTLLSIVLALGWALLTMAADCVDLPGHVCPTDADRRTTVLLILASTLAANVVLWFALIKVRSDK
ncbi:MAG: hypothetical protein R3C30_16545 [Hyphomonadaceae bacterium]